MRRALVAASAGVVCANREPRREPADGPPTAISRRDDRMRQTTPPTPVLPPGRQHALMALAVLLAAAIVLGTGCRSQRAETEPRSQGRDRPASGESTPDGVVETPLGKMPKPASPVVVSDDGCHFAYVTMLGKRPAVVVDGKTKPRHDRVAADSLVFSPRGDRLAYAAWDRNRSFVCADGERVTMWDAIARDSIVFSGDGSHLGYVAKTGGKPCVVMDGRPGQGHDDIAAGSVLFSPDGERMAYAAQDEGKWCVVADGELGIAHDQIGERSLLFSPDGERLAYLAKNGDRWLAIVNGQAGP